MAAAVVFPTEWFRLGLPPELRGLNDSKQVSPRQREHFAAFLLGQPDIGHGLAAISAETIDRINILRATHLAMNQALAQLEPAPEHVLVDGLRVSSLVCAQTPIVRGDTLSFSIAAASILAKVTRDRLMLEWDRQYPAYGFAEHKGYGTRKHLAAIARHGPCPIHRRSFAPFRTAQPELF
jgi:ribonuclease HII